MAGETWEVSAQTVASPVAGYEQTLYHGGDLHPDAPVHYATSDAEQAREYGDPMTVRVRFERPLYVDHERGKDWRTRLEETADGGWMSHLADHDGIVYRWPASTHWRTGRPVPEHEWAIGLPGTMSESARTAASSLAWTPGSHGKLIQFRDGDVSTWNVEGGEEVGGFRDGRPFHDEVTEGRPVLAYGWISPSGEYKLDSAVTDPQVLRICDFNLATAGLRRPGGWTLSSTPAWRETEASVQDLQLVPWAHGEPGKFVLFDDGLVSWNSARSRGPESMGGPYVHHHMVQEPGRQVRAMGVVTPEGRAQMHGAWGVQPSEVEAVLHRWPEPDMGELDDLVRNWNLSRVVPVQPGGGGHPPSERDWSTWHPFVAGRDGNVYVGGPGDWHADVRGQMPCYPRGMGAIEPNSGEVWFGSGWHEGPSKEEVLPQLREHFGVEPQPDWWLSRVAVLGDQPGEPREGKEGTPVVVDPDTERFWVGKPGQYHEDVWDEQGVQMARPMDAHSGLVHRGPGGNLVLEWYEGDPHPRVNEELSRRFGEPVADEGLEDEEWRMDSTGTGWRLAKVAGTGSPWTPGQFGKGFYDQQGKLHAWVDWTEEGGSMHHGDYAVERNVRPSWDTTFVLDPDGRIVWTAQRGTPGGDGELRQRIRRDLGLGDHVGDDESWRLGHESIPDDEYGEDQAPVDWEPGMHGKAVVVDGTPHVWGDDPEAPEWHHDEVLDQLKPDWQVGDDVPSMYSVMPDGSFRLEGGRTDGDQAMAHHMLDQWEIRGDEDPEGAGWRLGATDWTVQESDVRPEDSLLADTAWAFDHSPWLADPESRTVYLGEPGTHHADLANRHLGERNAEAEGWATNGDWGHVRNGVISVGASHDARGIVDALHRHLGPGFGEDLGEEDEDWRVSAVPPDPPELRPDNDLGYGMTWSALSLRDGTSRVFPAAGTRGGRAHAEYMHEHGISMEDVEGFWSWNGASWRRLDDPRFPEDEAFYRDGYDQLLRGLDEGRFKPSYEKADEWRLSVTATTIQEGTQSTGDPEAGERADRRPFLYDPRSDVVHVGVPGASHFDLVDEFDPQLDHMADDDVGEGGIQGGRAFFYDSNWREWAEDFPHVLQAVGDRYGVEPDYDEDDWSLGE